MRSLFIRIKRIIFTNKKANFIFLLVCLFLVNILSIGYSALNKSLTISGDAVYEAVLHVVLAHQRTILIHTTAHPRRQAIGLMSIFLAAVVQLREAVQVYTLALSALIEAEQAALTQGDKVFRYGNRIA